MKFLVQNQPCYGYTGGKAWDASKPTLLFIHGAANDHSVWHLQARWFAHHGWNVVAVDLPGHGRSDGTARTSISEHSQWVLAFLDNAAIESAVLVGHSMGSLIALDTALRAPARVAKLALLGKSQPGALYTDLTACHSYTTSAESIAALQVPTLLMIGEKDQMTPPKAGQALAKQLPRVTTRLVPDCGHSLMNEAPDAVIDALRDFFQ